MAHPSALATASLTPAPLATPVANAEASDGATAAVGTLGEAGGTVSGSGSGSTDLDLLVTCWFDDTSNRLELRATDKGNEESAVYTGAIYACELRPASAGGTATQAEREAAAAAVLQHVRLDAQGVLTTDASTGPTTGPAEATGSMGATVMKRGVSIGASFSIVSVDETPCGVAIRGFDVVQTRPLRCEVRAERGGPRRWRRLSAHAYIHRTEQFPF